MAASSYTVKLTDSTWVGATEIKAGEYKVQIEGDKAQFKMGKTVIEVPAKMETNDTKYSTTQFGTRVIGGKNRLEEIDFGRTTSRIVFNTGSTTSAGE